MKKLFIAALLFVGMVSFAQDATTTSKPQKERLTPEQRNEKHLKKLTTELNLDANQQAQVGKLLAEKSAKSQKYMETRKARKDSNAKPTAEEKAALKKEMMDEKTATETQMKSILNADQYKKWTAMREENKEKMKEKMKDRANKQ
ncbi:hypothetical protein [Flavobacterium sp. PL02]|jgi:protein CpxP|uniref:hypothetical protein n=1 Tax=Flavobacterium sp. PL02 TaxID=3088354 RepID=UPI002B2388E9|nr:hypothetical protein [Flavobacterium sp. PL02]MEA9411632.1 hypothetical protein [Flavobacterium sp. PL02]